MIPNLKNKNPLDYDSKYFCNEGTNFEKIFEDEKTIKEYIKGLNSDVEYKSASAKDKWEKIEYNLKEYIRNELIKSQNGRCAYCGEILGRSSSRRIIEHIAPKNKYPQFIIVKNNLVLACSLCNGFEKKGNKDTIKSIDVVYKKCKFKIVHPYFDNPEDHYEYIKSHNNATILIKGITEKGKESVSMFGLNDTPRIEGRYKETHPILCELRKLLDEKIYRFRRLWKK